MFRPSAARSIAAALVAGLVACGSGAVQVPAPPARCFATTALPLPDGCTPAAEPVPVVEGPLTCIHRSGGDRCAGADACWWVGARAPGATGTITCRSGTCSTTVEVAAGASVPAGVSGEWARMANQGEPAGFRPCDTPFPGPPLRAGR